MQVYTVKISREVNAFGLHYWVGLEASISEHENEVEALKILDGKIEQFCNPVIQTSTPAKKMYEAPEELPSIDINQM